MKESITVLATTTLVAADRSERDVDFPPANLCILVSMGRLQIKQAAIKINQYMPNGLKNSCIRHEE
jgi:hypothetical protein